MLEMVVGLEVTDDEKYTEYRREMRPILEEMGGGFGYDFVVREVLEAQVDHPINRVFTIYFPSREVMGEFFGLARYKEIKERHFAPAVAHTVIIAEYDRDG